MPPKDAQQDAEHAQQEAARAESRRVLLQGLAGLTRIVGHVAEGRGQSLPATQTCAMAVWDSFK